MARFQSLHEAVADNLKLRMPEIRDSILMLLSSRKPSELLVLEGKRKLGSDIVSSVNGILAPRETTAAVAKAKAPEPVEAKAEAPAEEAAALPTSGPPATPPSSWRSAWSC